MLLGTGPPVSSRATTWAAHVGSFMLASSVSGLPWPIPSQFQLQMHRALVTQVLGELGSGASHWIGLLLPDLVLPVTPPEKAAAFNVVRLAHPMAWRHAAGRFRLLGEPDAHWGAGQSSVSMVAYSPGIG